MKTTQKIKLEIIQNYIDWTTSNEEERKALKQSAAGYVEQDHVDEIDGGLDPLEFYEEKGYFGLNWSLEDIICKASENDHECTEEQARDIAANITQHGDCEFGITWEHICQEIEVYFEVKFSNTDLQFAIERLRSFDPPITVTKATDENLENCFAIDVEDQSFWYENESDRDSDFEKLRAVLTEFTFA